MCARKLQQPLPSEMFFWSQWLQMRHKQRIAQALLVIIPPHLFSTALRDRLLASLCCLSPDAPCGHCAFCYKLLADIHPDVAIIQPETPGAAIKIEQIRQLQQTAYQSPQLGSHSIIVIQPADNLNIAAASSLLKLLEEPPATTLFVLLASASSGLLPTLLSRCQRYYFPDEHAAEDPLSLGQAYPEGSIRATLFVERLRLLTDLDEMLAQEITPCMVAQRWSIYPLSDLVWFLYALTAKLIDSVVRGDRPLSLEYQHLAIFSKPWDLVSLFIQLDTIRVIIARLRANINLNPALALERILIGYYQRSPFNR